MEAPAQRMGPICGALYIAGDTSPGCAIRWLATGDTPAQARAYVNPVRSMVFQALKNRFSVG